MNVEGEGSALTFSYHGAVSFTENNANLIKQLWEDEGANIASP